LGNGIKGKAKRDDPAEWLNRQINLQAVTGGRKDILIFLNTG
jgi:hypothetical protein